MVQNEKRALDLKFLLAGSRRKLLSCKHMLPIMKKGRMNQRVEPKSQRELKAMEIYSLTLRSIKELLVLAWLRLRIAMD